MLPPIGTHDCAAEIGKMVILIHPFVFTVHPITKKCYFLRQSVGNSKPI